MINVNQLTSQLAKMADPMLQKFASMHKDDPYTVSLALAESNRRKELRAGAQARMAGQQQPKVVDQVVSQMAAVDPMGNVTGALPEDMGIGRLPAQNLRKLAGGGIVAFEEGGEVERYQNKGFTGYNPNAVFEQALRGLFEREGGTTTDTGGLTKYGISQKAYPDLDISSLTLNDAARLYKKDYWDAHGLNRLARKDPKLAAAAFDTFVNHGPTAGKKMLEESGGDVGKLLENRKAEYDRLTTENPKKYGAYAEGWNNRLSHLSNSLTGMGDRVDNLPDLDIGSTAQAAQKKEPFPLKEKESVGGAGVIPVAAGTGTGLAGILAPVREAMKPIFRPGTTLGQAAGQTALASAVPAATFVGGIEASEKAAKDLARYTTPEQRKAIAENPMLSAMSGDAGLAGAIMNAGQEEYRPDPNQSSYWDQMKNALGFIGAAPSRAIGAGIDKVLGLEDVGKPKTEKTAPKPENYDWNAFDKATNQYMAEREAKQGLESIAPKKELPAAPAPETTEKGGLAGLFKDPAFLMGMRLMSSQNPRLLGAVGEAGAGTAGDLLAQKKAETEDMYRKAYANYLNEGAGAIARGAKEKNEVQLAEKTAQEYFDTWSKNNKMALMANPSLGEQVRRQYRQEAYKAFNLPFPGSVGAGPTQQDPLGILSKG